MTVQSPAELEETGSRDRALTRSTSSRSMACVAATGAPLIGQGEILHETYEIVGRVGAGGMGEVYEARHRRLPGRFAVKVIRAVDPDETSLKRFRREAEIASSLRHPNVVQVVDFNQVRGRPYLVMEFLEGQDLATALRAVGRMPRDRAAAIVVQIANGLSAAHSAGVVHRDLKPQNIFLVRSHDGRDLVKVLDFGISKAMTAETLTGESALLGTPQYMSPEQARGEPGEIDARSDQFSLAAIAYELLTGRRPFEAGSIPATLFRIAHADPPSFPEADPLEQVLSKALAKNKSDRYPSVLEFATSASRAVAAGGPVAEQPADRGAAIMALQPETRTRPLLPGSAAAPFRRRRRAAVVAGVIFTLSAGFVVAYGVARRRPKTGAVASSASPVDVGDVYADLGLTPDQAAKAQDILTAMRVRIAALGSKQARGELTKEDHENRVRAERSRVNRELEQLLGARKLEDWRASSFERAVRDVTATEDSDEMQRRLNLTAEQTKKVDLILGAMKERGVRFAGERSNGKLSARGHWDALRQLESETDADIRAVLGPQKFAEFQAYMQEGEGEIPKIFGAAGEQAGTDGGSGVRP